MIVSNQEIEHVWDLIPGRPTPQELPGSSPADETRLREDDAAFRIARLSMLRQLFLAGRYDIAPDLLAERIIARAVSDQASRLGDRRHS